jgi:hypothetical protein
MHEFAELPGEELIKTLNGSAKKAAEEEEWGATEIEMLVWRLDRAHGDEKFFDE